MRKGIIIVCMAALMLVGVGLAYAETQSIKVGGDILIRGFGRYDMYDLRKTTYVDSLSANDVAPDEVTGLLSTVRLRVDADLTDNVSAVIRLINERRWAANDATATDTDNDKIALDLAYVKLKEFFYAPLTLTIGRQELHFGNDMIMGDISTNRSNFGNPASLARLEDWSSRKSFDAVRATIVYDPWTIDVVYAALNADNDAMNLTSDNVDLIGMNVGYDFGRYNAKGEGYFWYRDGSLNNGNGSLTAGDISASNLLTQREDKDKLFTVGGRANAELIKDLVLNAEMAMQFGQFPGGTGYGAGAAGTTRRSAERKAMAMQFGADYTWSKSKYIPKAGLWVSYFSGDKADATGGPYRGWDPMFENQSAGAIANYLYDMTDCYVQNLTGSIKPIEDVTLSGSYSNYWLARSLGRDNVASTWTAVRADGTTVAYGVNSRQRHLGQELDLGLTYDYTEDVQFGVLCGWYFPGSVYNGTIVDVSQLYSASMKVSF